MSGDPKKLAKVVPTVMTEEDIAARSLKRFMHFTGKEPGFSEAAKLVVGIINGLPESQRKELRKEIGGQMLHNAQDRVTATLADQLPYCSSKTGVRTYAEQVEAHAKREERPDNKARLERIAGILYGFSAAAEKGNKGADLIFNKINQLQTVTH